VSGVRLQWQGMTEFKTALRNLPEELTNEGGEIVEGTAHRAQQETQAGYPEGPTGNLRRRVVMEKDSARSKFGAFFAVRSRAPHAHIFEKGTGQRQTSKGANRGRMPEAPTSQQMVPVVIKHRRQMFERLKDLVRKAGFQVD
jgi:hypothetical protein